MNTYKTNKDKMLASVLFNKKLMETGGYSEKDFASFDEALNSDNPTVRTVARIIRGYSSGNSNTMIYNEITDYLKKSL